MKIKVKQHNLIKLIPETDSDYALLALWKDKRPYIANSGYQNGTTFELSIGFDDKKVEVKE